MFFKQYKVINSMRMGRPVWLAYPCLFVLLQWPLNQVSAEAGLLPIDLLSHLERHERVLAAEKEISVAEEARRSAYAAYLPTVTATLYQGSEKINNTDGSRTSMGIHEQGVNMVQSLYDFGGTDAQVDIADQGIRRAELALRFVQESLLMEGIAAYLGVEKSVGRVDYALQSESNIKKQTGMEESLVETGAGIPSDVLQTKAQLTGTQALRVQEEGMKRLAESRYWAVFGVSPQERPDYRVPEPFPGHMPSTLDQAIRLSDEHSAEIEMGRIDIEIARSTVKSQKANALPTLSFNLDYKQKHNVSGSAGDKTEGLAKVELSWPIYSGGSEQSAIDSSIHAQHAAELRLEDTRKRVHEAVRIAWHNWKTAKKTASLLNNQSNIAFEFLEQARVERKLGSRTLQDVLTGETTYLTAISNAVSAEIDYKIAAYQLLHAVGQLRQLGVNLPDSNQSEKEVEPPEETDPLIQQAAVESEEVITRVVEHVVEQTTPETSDASVLPHSAENSVELISRESLDVHVPLVPGKLQMQGEVDHVIHKSRSTYQQSVISDPIEQPPLAGATSEFIMLDPLDVSVPLTAQKMQSRDEADHVIHESRSAYQESRKRIQVESLEAISPVVPDRSKKMIPIIGSKTTDLVQKASKGRRLIQIESNGQPENISEGIRLVGPGQIGNQQQGEAWEEIVPQWIELR